MRVRTRILFLLMTAMMALGLLLGCQATPEPVAQVPTPEPTVEAVSPTSEPAYPAPPTLRPGYPPPEPTPTFAKPTEPPRRITGSPTKTNTPVPTQTPVPPTPVVTPIPTATPPTLPGVVGREQERFWLYAWHDNELWSVDDQGQNAEFLLDVHEATGAWLTAIPDIAAEGTDAFTGFGPLVVASPDGQKVALVLLVNKDAGPREPLLLHLYVLDVLSGELTFVGEGTRPAWSRDSRRLAFVTDKLQIVDLESGSVETYLLDSEEPIEKIVWSPDGRQIAIAAFNPSFGSPGSIWLQQRDGSSAKRLLGWEQELAREGRLLLEGYTMQWSPDGQSLFIAGVDDAQTWPMLSRWYSVSTTTGEKTLLFPELQGGYWGDLSSDGEWWLFHSAALYESSNGLWLFHQESGTHYRLTHHTSESGQVEAIGWSPDGTRLLVRVWEPEPKFYFYTFESGSFSALDFPEPIDEEDWSIHIPGGRDY